MSSVRPRAYLRNYASSLRQCLARVTRGRGSVLFWRRCDTSCTSGFVDDVMFAHDAANGETDPPRGQHRTGDGSDSDELRLPCCHCELHKYTLFAVSAAGRAILTARHMSVDSVGPCVWTSRRTTDSHNQSCGLARLRNDQFCVECMGGKTVLGSVHSVRVAWPDYTLGEVMSQNRWSR